MTAAPITATTTTSRLLDATPDRYSPLPLAWTDDENEVSEVWDRVFARLSAWLQHPDELGDDESESPSRDTIEDGITIAAFMRRAGLEPPDRVIPTAEGGIAFERRDDGFLARVELYPDGQLDVTSFDEDSRLVCRRPGTIADFLSDLRRPYVDLDMYLMSY